ncbi:unnamed protein product, partial [marine sediment metagenome]
MNNYHSKSKEEIFHELETSEKGLSQKQAQEMSVGTIVTIVLLMTVLILGLVLVRTIFKGSIENIESIDEAVKNEITKLFSEDDTRKVVIYPSSREISLKKGESGGFGFSIRNIEGGPPGSFSYAVDGYDIPDNCIISMKEANDFIILGKESGPGGDIEIPSLDTLENPILVKFVIPETASLCHIRYVLNVWKDGVSYLPVNSVSI